MVVSSSLSLPPLLDRDFHYHERGFFNSLPKAEISIMAIIMALTWDSRMSTAALLFPSHLALRSLGMKLEIISLIKKTMREEFLNLVLPNLFLKNAVMNAKEFKSLLSGWWLKPFRCRLNSVDSHLNKFHSSSSWKLFQGNAVSL